MPDTFRVTTYDYTIALNNTATQRRVIVIT